MFSIPLLPTKTFLSPSSRGTFQPGTSPGTYTWSAPGGVNPFTAVNGVPYVAQGSSLVPQGPVSGLAYGGGTYQFTGSSTLANGDWLSAYQTGGIKGTGMFCLSGAEGG